MTKISDTIYGVGVKDPSLNTLFNSYLIKSDKTALIDTIPERYSEELIANIEKHIPVSKLDYIICNHSEPDRSGAILSILERNPDVTIVGTITALKNLKKLLNRDFNEMLAKDGGILSLGGEELELLITPNLNWPDTMMTYAKCECALFSCDFLSSYYTENALYDTDIVSFVEYKDSVKKYFNANFAPFKPFVNLALKKIRKLDIGAVFCGNGPILTKLISDNLDDYERWSAIKKNSPKKISILYFSCYGSTRKLAEAALSALKTGGYSAEIYDVNAYSSEEIQRVIEQSDGIMLGTPTINRNASKEILDILTALDLIESKEISFAVFGSYGWSGEGPQIVNNLIKTMRLNTTDEPFRAILNPDSNSIQMIKEYTTAFAESL